MTFDPKCYELAKVFLSDHSAVYSESNINALASVIQESIDDWIIYREDKAADQEAKRSWG